jgi:hypothetical protein
MLASRVCLVLTELGFNAAGLAFGTPEHVAALLVCSQAIIAALVAGCTAADHGVVLACVRTLRTIYKSSAQAPISLLTTHGGDSLLCCLIGLIGENEIATEAAASLIAKCCCDVASVTTFVKQGAAKKLADTFQTCRQESTQIAILEALVMLTRESDETCEQMTDTSSWLLVQLRNGCSPQLSIMLASCIANFFNWSKANRSTPAFAVRRQVVLSVLGTLTPDFFWIGSVCCSRSAIGSHTCCRSEVCTFASQQHDSPYGCLIPSPVSSSEACRTTRAVDGRPHHFLKGWQRTPNDSIPPVLVMHLCLSTMNSVARR